MENVTVENSIWLDNPDVLFKSNNFVDIIPLANMSYEEKINAITRFCIYLSVLLILFTGNLNYLYIAISIILLFYLIHIFRPQTENFDGIDNAEIHNHSESNQEKLDTSIEHDLVKEEKNVIEPKVDLSNCRKPTEDNPLMNLNMTNITKPEQKRACNVNNKSISETIDKSFKDKLYLNTEVVYNTRNNQRDFYTMPITRAYSDQGAFANWLYNTPVSCAQGDEVALKQVRACSFNNKRLEEL